MYININKQLIKNSLHNIYRKDRRQWLNPLDSENLLPFINNINAFLLE